MENKYDLWSSQSLLPQVNALNKDYYDLSKSKSKLNHNYFDSLVSKIVDDELELKPTDLNLNQVENKNFSNQSKNLESSQFLSFSNNSSVTNQSLTVNSLSKKPSTLNCDVFFKTNGINYEDIKSKNNCFHFSHKFTNFNPSMRPIRGSTLGALPYLFYDEEISSFIDKCFHQIKYLAQERNDIEEKVLGYRKSDQLLPVNKTVVNGYFFYSTKLDKLIEVMLNEYNKVLSFISNLNSIISLVPGQCIGSYIMAWFESIQILSFKRNQEISTIICLKTVSQETKNWLNSQISCALFNLYLQTRSIRTALWMLSVRIESITLN